MPAGAFYCTIIDISGQGNDGVPVPILGATLDVTASPRAGALSHPQITDQLHVRRGESLTGPDRSLDA
jgi:hypothetical protein